MPQKELPEELQRKLFWEYKDRKHIKWMRREQPELYRTKYL